MTAGVGDVLAGCFTVREGPRVLSGFVGGFVCLRGVHERLS